MLNFKFIKEMFDYQFLFNQMNLSYDSKQFHWSYCYDNNVIHEFKKQ